MKHTRKTLAAIGLFALAPLVACDQGVEDASAPDGAAPGAGTQQPPADTRREPPAVEEPEPIDEPGTIDDPSAGG